MNQIQLQRMAELNIELFTCLTHTLRSIDDYCEKYHISIPNDPKIEYLASQALCLITEINENPANREVTGRRTTDNETEPRKN